MYNVNTVRYVNGCYGIYIQDGEAMAKSNEGGLIISLWNFSKAIYNESSNGVDIHTITDRIKNGIIIVICHGIPISFDIGVHG